MPYIQQSRLNKGHQRKLQALRKSLGKKIADEAFSKWQKENPSAKATSDKVDPIAARLAKCIGREDKKKTLKLPRGGYLIRRGFGGVILAEAAPAKKNKKRAAAKPKLKAVGRPKKRVAAKPKKKATSKPKGRKPSAKKATPKKAGRKKR